MKVPKLRTGSSARSALTAAVHGRPNIDGSRVRVYHRHRAVDLGLRFLRFISNPPADIAEGLSCAINQIPKRDRRCGVTTLKSAAAHGPGFLTGLHTTKIISAAPFRMQSIVNPFLSHRGRRSAEISFLDAETGRQNRPLKCANVGRDQSPGIEWPKIPQKRPIWRRAGNVRLARTGWWCAQSYANRSPTQHRVLELLTGPHAVRSGRKSLHLNPPVSSRRIGAITLIH